MYKTISEKPKMLGKGTKITIPLHSAILEKKR